MFFVFRKVGRSAGAFATHIVDIPGCGEPGILAKSRALLGRRFGAVKVKESPSALVGAGLLQELDFLVELSLGESTKNLKSLPPPPWLRIARQQPPSPGAIRLRECKLGESRGLATVSRPDICTRLARVAHRVDLSQGSDVHRINGLVGTVQVWQRATL